MFSRCPVFYTEVCMSTVEKRMVNGSITFGQSTVTVVGFENGKVRLQVEAPDDVEVVLRGEGADQTHKLPTEDERK